MKNISEDLHYDGRFENSNIRMIRNSTWSAIELLLVWKFSNWHLIIQQPVYEKMNWNENYKWSRKSMEKNYELLTIKNFAINYAVKVFLTILTLCSICSCNSRLDYCIMESQQLINWLIIYVSIGFIWWFGKVKVTTFICDNEIYRYTFSTNEKENSWFRHIHKKTYDETKSFLPSKDQNSEKKFEIISFHL